MSKNEVLEKNLLDLGFDQKEAKIFLALIYFGEQTVLELATNCELKRTTLYPILKSMAKRDLVIELILNKKRYFKAVSINEIVEKRKKQIDSLGEELIRLPKRIAGNSKAKIFFLEGDSGFKKVWEMLLEDKPKDYCLVGNPEQMLSFVKQKYIINKIIKRKISLGITSRQIISGSYYNREIAKKDLQEKRKTKFFSTEIPVNSTKIIWQNKVAILSPYHESFIVVIESQSFAKSEQVSFDAFWEKL